MRAGLVRAAAPRAPWLVDVSASAGALEATRGFGRAMVVDLDGDGHDDLVAMPTHDGPHEVPHRAPRPPAERSHAGLRPPGWIRASLHRGPRGDRPPVSRGREARLAGRHRRRWSARSAITGFRNPDENTLDVYRQTLDHRFERPPIATSGVDDRAQESIVWLDHDRDGDLDLDVAEESDPGRLYENRAADGARVLVVRLRANAPRVIVESGAGPQRRDGTSGNGHDNPQPSRALSFGLGDDACAHDVRIRRPDGSEQSLGPVAADQDITIEQGGAITARRIER